MVLAELAVQVAHGERLLMLAHERGWCCVGCIGGVAAGRAVVRHARVALLVLLGLPPRPILVVGMLFYVLRPQSLRLVDERLLVALGKLLPSGAQSTADLRVVHLGVLVRHLATLSARPDHEGVHRSLHVRVALIQRLLVCSLVAVLAGLLHQLELDLLLLLLLTWSLCILLCLLLVDLLLLRMLIVELLLLLLLMMLLLMRLLLLLLLR